MIKKAMLLTLLMGFTLLTFATPPFKHHKGMMVKQGMKGEMKALMFFKVVKESREQLNLTAKQNVELDKILRDVESYMKTLKQQRKKNQFEEEFVKDSFDPFKFEEEQRKKREETKRFFLSKIKAVHDLLTVKQREKLITIIKDRKKKMRKRIVNKWKKERMKRRR